jgi:hypothetical protein
MKKLISSIFTVALTLSLAMVSASCDQVERVASGVGGSKSSSSSSSNNPSSSDSTDDGESTMNSVDEGDSDDDSEAIQVAQADTKPDLQKIRLSAFTDFSCTSAWTNRDGGWGLRAGSGAGECSVKFPGGDGSYRVTLMAQLEFDGNPKFRIEVDGSPIAVGSYPMSMGKLVCDCPNWRVNCPDRIVPIDAGVHEIRQGSAIKFVAAEVYPCGGNHGAYAKWHELVFAPQE